MWTCGLWHGHSPLSARFSLLLLQQNINMELAGNRFNDTIMDDGTHHSDRMVVTTGYWLTGTRCQHLQHDRWRSWQHTLLCLECNDPAMAGLVVHLKGGISAYGLLALKAGSAIRNNSRVTLYWFWFSLIVEASFLPAACQQLVHWVLGLNNEYGPSTLDVFEILAPFLFEHNCNLCSLEIW